MQIDQNELHKREEDFHDEWALSENVEEVQVHALFESEAAMENKFILQHMGDLTGKKILDVGAGLGESSVYFALQGAEVYYNDISPKMGEFANKLAEKHGVRLHTIIGPIEKTEVGFNTFDFIYCANLMHHVPPSEHLLWLGNMKNALKDGGWLYTWDPLKYNPAINIYRSMATEVRTIDEMPLGFSILKTYKSLFKNVEHREFWLSTLMLFFYYYLIRRYNPNKIRYWKQIYKEDKNTLGAWFSICKGMDSILLKIPGIRALAWNTVICAQK